LWIWPVFSHIAGRESHLGIPPSAFLANLIEETVKTGDFPHTLQTALFQVPQSGREKVIEYVRDCHPNFAVEVSVLLEKLDALGRKLNRFIAAVERERR